MRESATEQAFQLAVRRHQAGQAREAEGLYRKILQENPNHPDALHLLGLLMQQSGHAAEGAELIRQAIRINPAVADYHNNLGNALKDQGQLAQAMASYREALRLRPQFAEAWHNLGTALQQRGDLDEAIAAFRQALSLRPSFAEAHYCMGNALKDDDRWDDAIAAYRRALELRPDFSMALNNLGTSLRDTGLIDEAIDCYRRAVALNASSRAADNLLYALYFHPADDPARIRSEHELWNKRVISPRLGPPTPHSNVPNVDRRLRIGYVSPDFRDHSQSMFMTPLLSHHDHGRFEIFCYSDVVRPDALTDRLRPYADRWQSIVGLPDQQVADLIRHDGIDVLVDLTLHMSNNRLAVFARKPAPVQVTWLGYPGTTGLDTIDYRFSDPYLDPSEDDEKFYSEQTLRLPESFWCYDPLTHGPPVNEAPFLTNGWITFGCLNNFAKVNDRVLDLWGRVLSALPDSRLLLLAPPGSSRDRVLARLGRHGVDSGRVEFVGRQPRPKYLETYHRIDVGLDSFPVNGHTTTMDALWMGVPVVSLAGRTAISRGGLSVLSNIGLPDLMAHAPDQFVNIAIDLARNRVRLSELRSTLRQRMQSSPLMDAGRFAGHIESVYRSIWKTWCLTRS